MTLLVSLLVVRSIDKKQTTLCLHGLEIVKKKIDILRLKVIDIRC
jgi:hypothetical protein